MATGPTLDVLICGAGASGLTLALELARRGSNFLLIDALDHPFSGSRGKGIQPRTQEIFEDLGVLDRAFAAGGSYPPQREYRNDGSFVESDVVEDEPPTAAEPYRRALMLPQFLTEQILRERLQELGHRPFYGHRLMGFEQDANGVTARVRHASSDKLLRARYLVGADGGRSFVRHELKIGFPGKTLGVRAVVADVSLSGLPRDAWHRFNEGSMEQQLALCPLMGTDLFQIQAPVPLEGDIDLSADGLDQLVRARTRRADIRVHAVSWASAYGMNARLADRYRDRRVFLVGDAAHVHPPTGGQGLNTSVQDAYNLGWKLAHVLRGAPDALLDTYEEERRPVAATVLGLSTRLLDAAKHGDVRRGREVRQLDIGYPGTALAMEAPRRAYGLQAGDRAPDACLRGAAGQLVRLFHLFKGPHWTLLGYEAERSMVARRSGLHVHVIAAGGELIDAQAHFKDAYELNAGEWVLVRPDGYIGALLASSEVAALETYLDRMGMPSASRTS